MNKENAVLFIPLVKALALGETLQVQRTFNGLWHDLDSVVFDKPFERYRIKPQERFVICGSQAKWVGGAIYGDKAQAVDIAARTATCNGESKVYQLVEVT